MKQNQLKNYLKLATLLFGMSLIGCQHDDLANQTKTEVNTNKSTYQINTKTYVELSADAKFTHALDKVLKDKKTGSGISSKTVMEEQYGFTIDSTLIKEIYSENYTS